MYLMRAALDVIDGKRGSLLCDFGRFRGFRGGTHKSVVGSLVPLHIKFSLNLTLQCSLL